MDLCPLDSLFSYTVGCNYLSIFASRRAEFTHGLTADSIRTVVRYFSSIAVGHVQRTIRLTPFIGDAASATANLGKTYDRNYMPSEISV
jgi:hypothetical protein